LKAPTAPRRGGGAGGISSGQLRTEVYAIRNRLDNIVHCRGSVAELDAQPRKVVVAQRVKQTVEIIAKEYERKRNTQQKQARSRGMER
jgi:hypothetical protein